MASKPTDKKKAGVATHSTPPQSYAVLLPVVGVIIALFAFTQAWLYDNYQLARDRCRDELEACRRSLIAPKEMNSRDFDYYVLIIRGTKQAQDFEWKYQEFLRRELDAGRLRR